MKKNEVKQIIVNIAGVVIALIFILPIVFTFALSIMAKFEIMDIKIMLDNGNYMTLFSLIPKSFSLRQYFITLINRPDFLGCYWNSVKIVLPIVIGQIVIGTLTAYGFANFKFKYRDQIFLVFIITMLLPFQVTLVPNFIVAIKLGTYTHFSSIYLPGMFSAFAVFYMRQYLKDIPDEVIEASRVDGANELQIITKIIVPIVKPFIFSLAVLTFIDTWNMVEQPLVMLSDKGMHPLSLVLATAGKNDFDIAFGASILYLLPALILYLCSRKHLESGLKHMSLK